MSALRISRLPPVTTSLRSGRRLLSTTAARSAEDAYILSAARTATGKMNGGLKDVPAPVLGSHAIKAALERSGVPPERVTDVYMGNVLQGFVGQSPARQALIYAGLPKTTEAVTINKVCASALKSVSFAAQNIQLGLSDIQVAGGMENMSRAPFYVARQNPVVGNFTTYDSLIYDGLTDVYNQVHMGTCTEKTAKELKISREEQDAYAIESYRRAKAAWDAGSFDAEVIPVTVKGRKGETVVIKDEEHESIKLDKVPTLKPVFAAKGEIGTITAANASTLNDGASAVVLGSKAVAQEFGGSKDGVLARIVSYADAATDPIDFPLAPTLAIPKALKRAGLEVKDVAQWEVNEAFSAVSLAINKTLNLPADKVNVKGGAVALGHALGSSGTRILTTLLYTLKPGEFGVAAICNGGGGATAMVVQKLDHV